MKELSIEEKAKAYDEAFKEAEKIHKFSSDLAEIKRMEQIFPELIDTDKVIKCLINGMKFYYEDNEDATWGTEKFSMKVKDIIKWLEKQDEKKLIIDGILTATNYDEMFQNCKVHKFNIGDWITDGDLHCKISDILDDRYIVDTKFAKKSCIHFKRENDYHLWTVQDAKDGDVLSDGTTIFIFKDLLSDGSVMSYCDHDTDSGESDAFCPLSVNLMCSKITPATKEQRDLLFQEVKEAGYKWDAEKKELKKIKQEPIWEWDAEKKELKKIEQKPTAWSEKVDLEKELNIWRHNHFHGRRDKEASGEYLKRNSQLDLAKYFFELGLKVKKENKL